MSTKKDTLFWKEIKEKPIPDKILPMYDAVINGPMSPKVFFDMVIKDATRHNFVTPMFNSHQWWQLLKGCGKYENIKRTYSDNFTKYSKMALNVHSNRIDSVLKIFPNHYDYLTEWYESV